MSDWRGLPRGSKVAAVVILVVLLQVIVVAVLGLGAIGREREEADRRARAAAERRAQDVAALALERTVVGLRDALETAARAARSPDGLAALPREDWLRAFREVYLVDSDGRIRAADRTLLHVPLQVIDDEAPRSDGEMARAVEQSLSTLPPGSPAAVEARRRYVREFPWRLDASPRYASAVGEALQLAKEVAAASPAPTLRELDEAVRLAWSLAATNDGRNGAENPGFPFVERELEALARARPRPEERDALLATLAGLRRARQGLLEVLEYVAKPARDAAAYPAPPTVFGLRGPDLVVGLASVSGGAPSAAGGRAEAVLARLDRRAVLDLAAGSVPAAALVEQGLRLSVVQREAPPAPDAVAVRARLQDSHVDPELDVEVRLVPGARAPEAAGSRATFYAFILALAALGVTVAGFVLARILRREVHLARLKADFVSNLSHELKTPLTSISMFAEMMREGSLREGPELEEGIGVIAQETERLQRIVGRMIEVARREASAAPYDLVPGDLNAAVRAACDRFRRLEKDPGIALAVDLAPGLPPVAMDAAAVDDAVTNLLSNASKYRRGDRVSVRVATRADGRRVEIVVEDDGIGIPRRDRRRVFEMFYRSENYLDRAVPGTGLGLALVRTIVRAHRGRVRVEAVATGGSRFRIALPRARGAAPAPPAPTAPRAAPPPPAPAAPRPTPSGGPR